MTILPMPKHHSDEYARATLAATLHKRTAHEAKDPAVRASARRCYMEAMAVIRAHGGRK